MLTYIHYSKLQANGSADIYPARFSSHKKKDTAPQLSESEIDYLQASVESKPAVVIFDEDIYSGMTLDKAVKFFENLLGKNVVPAANVDGYKDQVGEKTLHLVGSTALREKLVKKKLDAVS